jgi:hypothetical protein
MHRRGRRVTPDSHRRGRHGNAVVDARPLAARAPPIQTRLGDAEYVGHPFWSAIIDSGRTFVVRVGATSDY